VKTTYLSASTIQSCINSMSYSYRNHSALYYSQMLLLQLSTAAE